MGIRTLEAFVQTLKKKGLNKKDLQAGMGLVISNASLSMPKNNLMKVIFQILLISLGFSLILDAQVQKTSPVNYKVKNSAFPGKNQESAGDESDWLNQAERFLLQKEYGFKTLPGASSYCVNPGQRIFFSIDSRGYSVKPLVYSNAKKEGETWGSSFELISIDKGKASLQTKIHPETRIKNDYLIQYHKDFSIEYINTAAGLRQNFIVNRRPAGISQLRLRIGVRSRALTLALVNTQSVRLIDKESKTVLQYDDLKVWDANHNLLHASMAINGSGKLEIVIDEKNAVYPITVDPLNHTPEWTGTALGILPGLTNQSSVNALYGYAVTGLGDVNGDGYDDVAIGAPGMINLISGTGSLANLGAVFVYYGSANGLSPTPSVEIQPSVAVAGALFGFSIAGGDVDGDGKNDIIVGAPMDATTISTGGSGTATGTVGKVYVFSGSGLSPVVTTATASLQLSGTNILENGVNLSVNALFGYSVSVTEDLNSDGLRDIIVGAPAYAGIKTNLFGVKVIDVQSGGAFLFLSQGAFGYSIQSLLPPSSSLLGLGILNTNINGLLFGISVDGAGDYNGDGIPDVVVGAPAGVDLGSINALLSGQLLQGSAMIYYGNGSGADSKADATLSATSGGLLTNLTGTIANLANLFGYCVKGVKNTSGQRTGSILVGAPLGGTLTNLLGGLQVKTGTVSLFLHQSASPVGVVAPDQSLSSPRNSNSILNLIQSSLLFGFSIDNVSDVNCDGIPDIIIGEPASSGAQLISANVAGGSAYIFFGKSDGTYQSTPGWTLSAAYDASLGVNATSLTGFSVAGAFKVKGVGGTNKVLVGAPGATLDFGSGLLNLGNTLGTLFGLVAANNGIGKAYEFDTELCGTVQTLPLQITNFEARAENNNQVLVNWQVSTQRNVNDFIIERSTDGISWEQLGSVPAYANTDSAASFSITDNYPFTGISYYRVEQVDIDNTVFYTTIKAVDILVTADANLKMNNPFSSFVAITLHVSVSNSARADLFDITGKLIRRQMFYATPGSNNIQLDDLANFPKGIYILHVVSGNNEFVNKLVKQ